MATSGKRVGNLEVWYVNRDDARIGNNLEATVQSVIGKPGSLGWKIVKASDAGDDEAIINTVIGEAAWAVVVGAWSLLTFITELLLMMVLSK